MINKRASFLVCGLLTLACLVLGANGLASDSGTFTYYVLGAYVTKSLCQMQVDEDWSRQGGHMPWRREPALVARVMAANLMPALPTGEEPVVEETREGAWLAQTITTSSMRISFQVVSHVDDVATVAMFVNGVVDARVDLERPLGYWWYITSAALVGNVVPQIRGSDVQWVGVRDALSRRGFNVYWSAKEHQAIVVKGLTSALIQVGNPSVRVGDRIVRLESPPKIVRGHIIVPEHLVAELLVQDVARLACRSSPSTLRWTARLEFPAGALAIPMGLAVADDGTTVVALGKYPGVLFLVDGSSGAVRWQYRSRGDFVRGAATSANGDRIVLKDARALVPQTERAVDEMVMLSSDGQVLWKREAPGAARLSPSGDHILTYDPENDFGIKVYNASEGSLSWEVSAEQLMGVEKADLTPDGRRILVVHMPGRISLFTATGNLVWARDFDCGVHSASTSRTGDRTAMLLGDSNVKLTIVDQQGKTCAEVPLLNFPQFESRAAELGDWYSVAASPSGQWMLLGGILPGFHRLMAVDPIGNILWTLKIPVLAEGSGASFGILNDSTALVVVSSRSRAILYFVGSTGTVRDTIAIQGRLEDWRASPNGAFLSVLVNGTRLESYKVPQTLTKPQS